MFLQARLGSLECKGGEKTLRDLSTSQIEADKILTSPRSDASTLTFDEGLDLGSRVSLPWGKSTGVPSPVGKVGKMGVAGIQRRFLFQLWNCWKYQIAT